VSTVASGDLECVPNPWIFEVYLPSCAGMDVWLWTGRRWCLVFSLFFSCDSRRLHGLVALDQCVDDLLERGCWVGRVDLEELGW